MVKHPAFFAIGETDEGKAREKLLEAESACRDVAIVKSGVITLPPLVKAPPCHGRGYERGLCP
jgi:hypothetical protein